MENTASKPEVVIEGHGTICTILPLTAKARTWIAENTQNESWQWMGGKLCV